MHCPCLSAESIGWRVLVRADRSVAVTWEQLFEIKLPYTLQRRSAVWHLIKATALAAHQSNSPTANPCLCEGTSCFSKRLLAVHVDMIRWLENTIFKGLLYLLVRVPGFRICCSLGAGRADDTHSVLNSEIPRESPASGGCYRTGLHDPMALSKCSHPEHPECRRRE